MEKKKDYIWAIFLIFLGTMFLLNTTGVLEWSIWLGILRFWPIFLVLAGLKMILGESKITTIITSSILIIFLAIILFCTIITTRELTNAFLSNCQGFCKNFVMQDGTQKKERFNVVRERYEDVENINYEMNLGVSKFEITDGADEYMELDARFSEIYGRPEIVVEQEENTLDISMKESRGTFTVMGLRTPQYDFKLASEILSNLRIINGVGSGDITLENTLLEHLKVTTGTGEIKMELGFDSIPTEGIDIEVGTGNVKLTIPSNVGYIINYSLGVGNIKLDGVDIDGIGRDGKDVRSSNYDEAEKFVNIDAKVGVGNLEIKFN